MVSPLESREVDVQVHPRVRVKGTLVDKPGEWHALGSYRNPATKLVTVTFDVHEQGAHRKQWRTLESIAASGKPLGAGKHDAMGRWFCPGTPTKPDVIELEHAGFERLFNAVAPAEHEARGKLVRGETAFRQYSIQHSLGPDNPAWEPDVLDHASAIAHAFATVLGKERSKRARVEFALRHGTHNFELTGSLTEFAEWFTQHNPPSLTPAKP